MMQALLSPDVQETHSPALQTGALAFVQSLSVVHPVHCPVVSLHVWPLEQSCAEPQIHSFWMLHFLVGLEGLWQWLSVRQVTHLYSVSLSLRQRSSQVLQTLLYVVRGSGQPKSEGRKHSNRRMRRSGGFMYITRGEVKGMIGTDEKVEGYLLSMMTMSPCIVCNMGVEGGSMSEEVGGRVFFVVVFVSSYGHIPLWHKILLRTFFDKLYSDCSSQKHVDWVKGSLAAVRIVQMYSVCYKLTEVRKTEVCKRGRECLKQGKAISSMHRSRRL